MDTGTRPDGADEDANGEDAPEADASGTGADETAAHGAEPGGPGTASAPAIDVETTTPTGTTRRLHPRIRIVWLVRAAVLAAVAGGLVFGAGRVLPLPVAVPEWAPGVVAAAVLLVAGAHALLRYRYWRFELREDAIYLERGVFTRVRTVVPFVRIQHVDSRRGPLERVAGLASCVVYSAGSRGADVRIPGLTPDDADALREDLKRLAIGAEGEDGV